MIAKGHEANPFEVKLRPGTLSFDEKSQRYVIFIITALQPQAADA